MVRELPHSGHLQGRLRERQSAQSPVIWLCRHATRGIRATGQVSSRSRLNVNSALSPLVKTRGFRAGETMIKYSEIVCVVAGLVNYETAF